MDFAVCRTQEVSALLSCRSSIGRRQLRGCVGVTQKPGDQVTTNPLFFFVCFVGGIIIIIIIYYHYILFLLWLLLLWLYFLFGCLFCRCGCCGRCRVVVVAGHPGILRHPIPGDPMIFRLISIYFINTINDILYTSNYNSYYRSL